MFYNVKKINIEKIVNNFSCMFFNYNNLNDIEVSNINTKNTKLLWVCFIIMKI